MSAQRRPFIQDTIALVYDFDGTLSPQPMQEYTVLPEIGVAPAAFWDEVNRQARANGEEAMLTYMRLIVEQANEKRVHIGREELKRLGRNVKYFPGVKDWFEASNRFVAEHGGGRIKLRHYIISAGLKEILEGVSIKRHFSNIFASEYHYDHHKVATFPKLLITDTTKTQFLFRINKGKEGLGESINTHMPATLRPIPFENMIYIGDGETDVPSMTVTRQQGGSAIAVYKTGRGSHERQTQATCKTLLEAGRVNFIAPADYASDSVLAHRVQLLLRSVMARIEYQRELHNCRREHGIGE
ncbi:MAG: HAD family hydrolase [Gammaproteobacteria bacterium]